MSIGNNAIFVKFHTGCRAVYSTIGIVSAMDNEIDLLHKEAVIDRVDTIADVKYHVGSLRGQPVVITRSGIGKVRAASGATTLLNTYQISKTGHKGLFALPQEYQMHPLICGKCRFTRLFGAK